MYKVCDAVKLCEMFGESTTLKQLREQIQGDRVYKCPKCEGSGKQSIKYDAYPRNAPDSGWAHDWKWREEDCDLCNGHGYTAVKMKAKVVTMENGWEPEENQLNKMRV